MVRNESKDLLYSDTDNPQKFSFELVFFCDDKIKPVVLPECLNKDTDLDILESTFNQALIKIMENVQHYLDENLIFQPDGAPLHYLQNSCWIKCFFEGGF